MNETAIIEIRCGWTVEVTVDGEEGYPLNWQDRLKSKLHSDGWSSNAGWVPTNMGYFDSGGQAEYLSTAHAPGARVPEWVRLTQFWIPKYLWMIRSGDL